MKRYWGAVALILVFFTILFLTVEQLEIAFLVDPLTMMSARDGVAIIVGIVLLTIDVLLPVPSSLVMIANGALFGVLIGSGLSIVGSLCAASLGFAIGRWGGPLLYRFIPLEEQQRANQLLNKWGWFGILVTRPLPLLAETTVIMAGASSMRWQTMLLASLAGVLPSALLYAFTGAMAVNFNNVILSFGLVLLMAAFFWVAGQRIPAMNVGKSKGQA